MSTTALVAWAKSLIQSFGRPQQLGTELERYIINHNPQNGGDIERLTRQYDNYISQGRTL